VGDKKGRKAKRREHDVYETPLAQAIHVCRWVAATLFPSAPPAVIWEPHSGTGMLVDAARRTWPAAKILAFDLRGNVRSDALARGADAFLEHDWLKPLPTEIDPPALILANPPFDGIEKHVALILDRLPPGAVAAIIGDCNLLWPSAPKEPFWDVPGLERFLPLYPRADYIGAKSTGATSTAVFQFRRGHIGGIQMLRPSRWRGNAKKAQTQLDLGGAR
jgi:hypothetical protein